MAQVIPSSPEYKNQAEEIVCDFIGKELPEDWVCYFNYCVGLAEFDVALMIPDRGIFVVEIKGISASQPLVVKDNQSIIYGRSGRVIPSPLKQCDKYRYKLLNKIRTELGRSPLVFSTVAYPNITYNDFTEKRLDIISEKERTFLKEDFQSGSRFVEKIENLYQHIKFNSDDCFDRELMDKVRALFEPGFSNTGTVRAEPESARHYSMLIYTQDGDEEMLKGLLNEWSRGTKVTFVTANDRLLNCFYEMAEERLRLLNLDGVEAFRIRDDDGQYKGSVFNLNFIRLQAAFGTKKIIIKDGDPEQVKEHEDFLNFLDRHTLFNLEQYRIEHAVENSNIIIRAGAGTGKTYSMISRINYLIFKHSYSAEDLKKRVVMITFTNEAARNMKDRLQEHFKDLFLLTNDIGILNFIEIIEDLKISTIHALSKRILEKYSACLGLGSEIEIKTGIYELNRETERCLDFYINNNGIAEELEDVTMYELQKRIKDYIKNLKDKSIDILHDRIDYGRPVRNKNIWTLINVVSKEVEQRLIQMFMEDNAVRLSDLMIVLKKLIMDHRESMGGTDEKVDYLFVDEFQDTDDTQINMMKAFRDIFGFSFFVVGDIKQCIYRFRGAEKEAFQTLLKGEDEKNWTEFVLTKNYRSDKKLLDKYNSVFKGMGAKGYLDYQEDKDKLIGVREYNCEEDSFFNRIDFCNETEREEQFIKELINLKAQQKGGEQIAILVRENKQVEHIRKLCSQNGIYVYTDVGGDLYRIRPTIDLYKLMLALQNNKNPVYLYNLFTTSYVSESLPKLMIYKCKGKKEKLLKWFNTSKVLERWDEYVSEIKREPAMKVIKSIINDVKPWINYAGEAELDEEKRRRQVYYKRNLEEVLEKLISMTNTDYLSINKIQKTLEIMILTKQDEEQREYDSDYNKDEKIVCMTIHKAKGLEFHTVIMPYCQAELAGERKTGYVDLIVEGETEQGKDIKYNIGYKLTFRKAKRSGSVITKNNYYDNYLENERFYRKQEETRLLYVAMTRAIKRFFYFHQRKCREQDNWQALISKGLGEGL